MRGEYYLEQVEQVVGVTHGVVGGGGDLGWVLDHLGEMLLGHLLHQDAVVALGGHRGVSQTKEHSEPIADRFKSRPIRGQCCNHLICIDQ